MFFKEVIGSWIYNGTMTLLYAKWPLLSKYLGWAINWFAEMFFKAALEENLKQIDFNAIDEKYMKTDVEYAEVMTKVKQVDEKDEEISDEERQALLDAAHAVLDKSLKLQKKFIQNK